MLCLVAVLFYFYINHRDSNKRRLEEITEIKLPGSVIILHDEYQDMGQDYHIIYNIQFDSDNIKEFTKNIKLSKFYNFKINTNSRPNNSLFVRTEKEKKAIWYKSPNGYHFSAKEGIAWHSIELDTLTKILKYDVIVY